MATMQVVVPPELPPDRTIFIQTPAGQRLAIQVPPGAAPGQANHRRAQALCPVTTTHARVPYCIHSMVLHPDRLAN